MNMSEKVIVSVCEGKIQGFKNKSTFSGAEFYSFLGVPYGQSTAGYARFKDPVEVKPWKNMLNANVEKGGCFQFAMVLRKIDGTEDCLYNNIHTPQILQKNDQSLKAVVVSIHPGSHHTGSPDPSYFGSPDNVMHNDIVYVCVGFRLHILGFLNLDMKECSGNQTLKDIILSLKWIKKNIRNFGGDPDNITLMGSSSGAEIVNHLMTSPRAKGLFHKGVILGIYKYCPTIIAREHNSTVAFDLAQTLGYKGPNDKKKLLLFYRKLDMKKTIFSRPERFFIKDYVPLYPYSPFIATHDFGENPVLPSVSKQKDLESMVRIPLMVGICEREAAMGFLREFSKNIDTVTSISKISINITFTKYPSDQRLYESLRKIGQAPFRKTMMENFYKSIRQNFRGWGSKLNDSQLEILRNRIDSFYLNGKSIENTSLEIKCNIQTDMSLSDLYKSLVDVVAADCPSSVYVYKFEFEGNVAKMKDIFEFTFEERLNGTFHGDDYSYWSQQTKKTDEPLTPETEEMIKKYTKLLCTFAKTGNPNYDGITTQWKPTTVENPCYLSINDNLHMVDGKLNGPRMEFWENLKIELETNDLISSSVKQ